MSEENVWEQLPSPNPPLFLGKQEKDFVKQVNDELAEKIIGQQILYYPVDTNNTSFNMYGEAIVKGFLPPIRVFCSITFEGQSTESKPIIDRRTKISVALHTRRLHEDIDLEPRVGDYIKYGEDYFEIKSLEATRELFGQVNSRFEITLKCVYCRQDMFSAI